MKKNMKWMNNLVLSAILGLSIFAVPVQAAEVTTPLPDVEIILDGTAPETEEEYVVVLQADDAANPMPAGAKDGVYTMTVEGEGRNALPQITFNDLGKYEYTIWQEAGDNEDCTYDESVYNMLITVTNNDTYDGYNVVVALYKEGETEKQDTIVFENVYEVDEVVKTGDSSNIYLYMAIMAVSLVVATTVLVKKRRND